MHSESESAFLSFLLAEGANWNGEQAIHYVPVEWWLVDIYTYTPVVLVSYLYLCAYVCITASSSKQNYLTAYGISADDFPVNQAPDQVNVTASPPPCPFWDSPLPHSCFILFSLAGCLLDQHLRRLGRREPVRLQGPGLLRQRR